MSKTTFVLLNNRTAWVGAGESGARPTVKSLSKIDMTSLTTVEEQASVIVDAISKERLPKKSIVLVVGPQQTEYRPFQVPPVGSSELPTIVANLASTQMTKIDDDSIVDFVAMPTMTAGGQTVLVTATSFQTNLLLAELKSKGLTFDRIIPRLILPNLLRNSAGADVQVLIVVLGSEIDFVATQAKQVVMVRSSVIPTEGDDRAKLIARETSRSVAVLAAEFGRIDKMDLGVIAANDDAVAVTGAMTAQDLTARMISPADFGTLPPVCESNDEVYAAMALAALRLDRKPLLDFANPTQPPKDHALKRKIYLSLALVATILLGVVGLGWLEIRNLDSKLANLQADLDAMKVAEVTDSKTISRVETINQFVAMDVAPLQLLEKLSQQLPYGDELRLQSLKISDGLLKSESTYPVEMTAHLKSKEVAEVYKAKLQANADWKMNPVSDVKSKANSNHYATTVVEKIEVTPDFAAVYDRLVEAVLGPESSSDQMLPTEKGAEPEETKLAPVDSQEGSITESPSRQTNSGTQESGDVFQSTDSHSTADQEDREFQGERTSAEQAKAESEADDDDSDTKDEAEEDGEEESEAKSVDDEKKVEDNETEEGRDD
ncbi:MAG: hypothetical protein JNL67_20060 [Planctomycetaceae bacterium]|nr:hypothetical protein [Planctomycetaceae bacterium]